MKMLGRAFLADHTASTKALKQECVGTRPEAGRSPVRQLEQVSMGRR